MDARSEEAFSNGCIRNALNVPSNDFNETKCQKYSWDEGKCTLKDAAKDFKYRKVTGIYEFVIVYDDNEGDACRSAAVAIAQESKFKNTNIFILQGGFAAFERKYKFLCSSLTESKRSFEGLMPTEIIQDFLYLGSNESARNKKLLDVLQISCVLNMADELENAFPNDFEYKKCGVNDTIQGSNFHDFFLAALEFIDNANASGKRVFVHCAMGISRSPAIVIAWLMKHNKWSVGEARSFVKQQRRCIQPNPGFVEYLEKYQQEVQGV